MNESHQIVAESHSNFDAGRGVARMDEQMRAKRCTSMNGDQMCNDVAPFECRARVFFKDHGCGKSFCKNHAGKLSLFFF